MLTVAVDERFARAIDDAVKLSGIYSSRSEFMKDSLRKNMEQAKKLGEGMKRMREETRKLAALAKSRGYKGGLLTRKEKNEIALEFIREHNL